MEGIFFYACFAMMLALKRQNKMVGIGQQFEYIMRDESLHLAFGCDLINTIVDENPSVWSLDFQAEITELVIKAVKLEKIYARDACPVDTLGIISNLFGEYAEYIADRRLERIHLKIVFGAHNPFPWMSQSTDLNKEKNFFETRVTEYQTGGAPVWS
jgi:ribonucleoside-diphosphate reductase beta chain